MIFYALIPIHSYKSEYINFFTSITPTDNENQQQGLRHVKFKHLGLQQLSACFPCHKAITHSSAESSCSSSPPSKRPFIEWKEVFSLQLPLTQFKL